MVSTHHHRSGGGRCSFVSTARRIVLMLVSLMIVSGNVGFVSAQEGEKQCNQEDNEGSCEAEKEKENNNPTTIRLASNQCTNVGDDPFGTGREVKCCEPYGYLFNSNTYKYYCGDCTAFGGDPFSAGKDNEKQCCSGSTKRFYAEPYYRWYCDVDTPRRTWNGIKWYFEQGNSKFRMPITFDNWKSYNENYVKLHRFSWGNAEAQNYDMDSMWHDHESNTIHVTPHIRRVRDYELSSGNPYALFSKIEKTSPEGRFLTDNGKDNQLGISSVTIPYREDCSLIDRERLSSMLWIVTCRRGGTDDCRIAPHGDPTKLYGRIMNEEGGYVTSKFDGNSQKSDVSWKLVKDSVTDNYGTSSGWSVRDPSGTYCLYYNLYSHTTPDKNIEEAHVGMKKCDTLNPNAYPDSFGDKNIFSFEGIFSSRIRSEQTFNSIHGSDGYNICGEAKLGRQKGVWPTFWLLPSEDTPMNERHGNGKWPDTGEIDIFDHVANDGNVVHAVTHTKQFNNNNDASNLYWDNKYVWQNIDNFNEVCVHVNPQRVKWSQKQDNYEFTWNCACKEWECQKCVTGEQNCVNGPDQTWQKCPFDKEFFLIFNVAFGGNWGGEGGMSWCDFWSTNGTHQIRNINFSFS